MIKRLHRCYGEGYLHFITTSCYRRQALLGTSSSRGLFLEVLECVRRRYHFVVVGYVVMPEHVHLLVSESERGDLSTVMQAIKQGYTRRVLAHLGRSHADVSANDHHIWQRRFYDFAVWTAEKRQEKLHYIHQNPVKRGLVSKPEEWRWSSARYYLLGEPGPVLVNERVEAKMKIRRVG